MLNIIVGFGAERFVASLLALTPFGSYNKRVSGSAMLRPNPRYARTSDTRKTLYAIPSTRLKDKKCFKKFRVHNFMEVFENDI